MGGFQITDSEGKCYEWLLEWPLTVLMRLSLSVENVINTVATLHN